MNTKKNATPLTTRKRFIGGMLAAGAAPTSITNPA